MYVAGSVLGFLAWIGRLRCGLAGPWSGACLRFGIGGRWALLDSWPVVDDRRTGSVSATAEGPGLNALRRGRRWASLSLAILGEGSAGERGEALVLLEISPRGAREDVEVVGGVDIVDGEYRYMLLKER